MLPDGVLSSQPIIGATVDPVKQPGDFLVDWERGGIGLNDSSRGLLYQLWKLEVLYVQGVQQVILSANNHYGVLFTPTGVVTEASLAFDQNMRPFVAFVEDGQPKIYWYDTALPGQTTTTLPAGVLSPRCTTDEKRPWHSDLSDIVLAYVRAGNLCVCYQRERYQTEHVLAEVGPSALLVNIGLNRKGRLQWRLQHVSTQDVRFHTQVEPYLADVVTSLLRKSDIPPENIDTSHLWLPIQGYRIASEGGADVMLQPLQSAYFFDPGQWDKKLRFVPRGGEPVAHLTFDDLLERDGEEGPLKIEQVQEFELLRKVNVTMVDSEAGWIANKQTAERRSATIQAIGESSVVIPITASPQFILTVATKRLRVPWGEPNKFNYAVGVPWSALTPTDVIAVTDRRGRTYRMRLQQQEEDYGTLKLEANTSATWVYRTEAADPALSKPSVPPVPGRAGDTFVVVVNIPVQRDQDDQLGYYIAVAGTGKAWNGATLEVRSAMFGLGSQKFDIDYPSVVGLTESVLETEHSSEYLSSQTLRVALSAQPEAISREDLLSNANRAAVQRADGTWEVLQYQNVAQMAPQVYELSGLLRGRYATEPLEVPIGARFVLLDESLYFFPVQKWMLERQLLYRGITYGQSPDDVDYEVIDINHPQSQTEWPVHYLRAERDSSDNVTVSWIGRARLGVEAVPYHSQYFEGYRVTYSDGYSAVGTNMSHTRSNVPVGATVKVAAVNRITGDGPYSEEIIT